MGWGRLLSYWARCLLASIRVNVRSLLPHNILRTCIFTSTDKNRTVEYSLVRWNAKSELQFNTREIVAVVRL